MYLDAVHVGNPSMTCVYDTLAQSSTFAIDPALAEDSTNHAQQPVETSADRTASKQYVGNQAEEVTERNPGPGSAENNIGLDERGKLKKWCLNCEKWLGIQQGVQLCISGALSQL